MGKLVILRGPSGAGKSTVAGALFKQIKEPAVLINQDYYRFIFKPAGGKLNSKSIHKMIKANVLLGLSDGYDVILEGIFTKKSYSQIFEEIFAEHPEENYIFTFDISFAETIQRHRTKANKDEWSESDMEDWYKSHELMGLDCEHVIGEESSVSETVKNIKKIAKL